MAIEVNPDKAPEKHICVKCGSAYGRKKGNFPVSYAELYKGSGVIPICFKCIDGMYTKYLAQCHDSKLAVRQVCRKLDLYWDEKVFEYASKQSSSRTVMTKYMTRINSVSFAGKSYDDTLLEEGNLWNISYGSSQMNDHVIDIQGATGTDTENTDPSVISPEVIDFWGIGYSPDIYRKLEQRKNYYMNKFPDAFSKGDETSDIGSDILIRQLCNIEVNIANGTASIDKSANTINTLIGSLNFKPAQKKTEDIDSSIANTPMGVWLLKYENQRPLPPTDSSLKDVNKIKKYIFTWMGHACKMLGIKNGYTKMYEDEIARLRVEKPEYADEDEESLIIDSYNEVDENASDENGGANG